MLSGVIWNVKRMTSIIASLMGKRERRVAMALFCLILVVAIMELVSVGSIMPLMSVITDPSVLIKNRWLSWAYRVGQFDSSTSFVIFLGIVFFFLVTLKNALSFASYFFQNKFFYSHLKSVMTAMLKKYAYSDLDFHVTSNSSVLAKNIHVEAHCYVQGILTQIFVLLSESVISLALLALLFCLQPMATLLVSLTIGLPVVFLTVWTRNKTRIIGANRERTSAEYFKIATQLLTGFKEIKLYYKERYFLDRFELNVKTYSQGASYVLTLINLPRLTLEVIASMILCGMLMLVVASGKTIESVIPIMSVYALGSFRLMPSINRIFTAIQNIGYNLKSLAILDKAVPTQNSKQRIGRGAISLSKAIQVEELKFVYPRADKGVLSGVNLSIKAGSSVGIVGASGAGKSTFIDLLLGFLVPTAGRILVDGVPLNASNLATWRSLIGYIPQSVFLLDDTIKNNIAFCEEDQNIDILEIHKALEKAKLKDLVDRLPHGIDTMVGENGAQISGGERQRIAIARALYRDPQLLIMDEPTSALDRKTESELMATFKEVCVGRTSISVTHGLHMLDSYDTIFSFEGGKAEQVIPEQLLIRQRYERSSSSLLLEPF